MFTARGVPAHRLGIPLRFVAFAGFSGRELQASCGYSALVAARSKGHLEASYHCSEPLPRGYGTKLVLPDSNHLPTGDPKKPAYSSVPGDI